MRGLWNISKTTYLISAKLQTDGSIDRRVLQTVGIGERDDDEREPDDETDA